MIAVSLNIIIPVVADEMDEEVTTHRFASPEISDFNLCEDGTYRVEDGGYIISFEVRDVSSGLVQPNYSEWWSYGNFTKEITATITEVQGNSLFAEMTATFTGYVNPGIAQITSVYGGQFYATIITPTGSPYYSIDVPSVNPSGYAAIARYSHDYNILGAGNHRMSLYLYLNTQAKATIFMQGDW